MVPASLLTALSLKRAYGEILRNYWSSGVYKCILTAIDKINTRFISVRSTTDPGDRAV
jgi:hypothetical protein